MIGQRHVTSEVVPHDGRRGFAGWLGRVHRDKSGATSTEYILILALVVLPIALLYPLFMTMMKTYAGRMTSLMGMPFP